MNNPLDAYTMKARLVPSVIAGAPAFAFAAIFVSWGGLGLTHLIAATALTVLFAVFADVARRHGNAIEPKLIERMGGLPTTTTLRHRDDTYDDDTRAGFHAFIAAKLGKPAPTAAGEAADPAAADSYYARGATWLRENTRDAKKFDILRNENISYGFRRNLLGLKLPGLPKKMCSGVSFLPEEGTLTDEHKERIKAAVDATRYYDLKAEPNRYYLVDHFTETDLKKTSSGGILGLRYLDLS